MPLTEAQRQWYLDHILRLDPRHQVVTPDLPGPRLVYSTTIRCDESHDREATEEELVRALALCVLAGKDYKYPPDAFYIEKYFKHGHPASKRDEVDLIIFDDEGLPFALWEFKSAEEFDSSAQEYIQYQLFGTAPLVGAPKLLVYATIKPNGSRATLNLVVIDRTLYQSYDSWQQSGQPYDKSFPEAYTDPTHQPFVQGGKVDLRFDCTQADFRSAAATFHNEFFGEHPDNVLYTNLVKCLLAKIFDERQTKKGIPYGFQVLYKRGKEESAASVLERVNGLYKTAYVRYIEPGAAEPDEINPKEFSPERVKTVVKVLQGMSITRGAALHGDVIGAFFEEILRAGFKQDKGMYFTHANLVYFIIEAIDLQGLAVNIWGKASHPENRLPYVIDPACGSGTFLLRAMHVISNAIRSRRERLVTDLDSTQFFDARMSEAMPNYWAENFLYGMDPKFVMAITAKVNMVLHGDGSAHIFKYDALKPFSTYEDPKLRPLSDPHRTIPESRYRYPLCESFDVVVSNPPFGITLSSDTKATHAKTFCLRASSTSESLFLERWFQLLKPKGRLGVVVPESLLNTADSVDARLFLYRTFWIRAIVSLPRNLFIETPTLTSLLFAQKKTKAEIDIWDVTWSRAVSEAQNKIDTARAFLRTAPNEDLNLRDVQNAFLSKLSPILSGDMQITKKGKAPLTVALPDAIKDVSGACAYYLEVTNLSGFTTVVRNYVFAKVCDTLDYEYPVYMVDEVGYKLSKRKERIRPNQLARFVGLRSKMERPNIHLANEPIELEVKVDNPDRVAEFIRRDVKWL